MQAYRIGIGVARHAEHVNDLCRKSERVPECRGRDPGWARHTHEGDTPPEPTVPPLTPSGDPATLMAEVRDGLDANSNAPVIECSDIAPVAAMDAESPRPKVIGGQTGPLGGQSSRHLEAVWAHEIAANTLSSYRTQWRSFCTWAATQGVPTLPAEPNQIASYLAERIEVHGHKPATLRVAASAIAFAHRAAGLDDPCSAAEVRRTLSGASRKAGRFQKQAEALTADAFAAICSTARIPRPGRGGRLERPTTAAARGDMDIALIGLMRDAMLRVSEAAALAWQDITRESDGTGRLLLRRSKTDPEGEGNVLFISAQTMAALRPLHDRAVTDSVFGLSRNQIARRIKQAARAAGLGEGFSGHSPRIGMARDLARAGIELPRLMNAGRWRTPSMPALYTRNETAARGAVAEFYGHRPQNASADFAQSAQVRRSTGGGAGSRLHL